MVRLFTFVILLVAIICLTSATTPRCPNKCTHRFWAERHCRKSAGCKLVSCEYTSWLSKRVKEGLSCVEDAQIEPTPDAHPKCPEKCTDLHWAKKNCAGLSGCKVVECKRRVFGIFKKSGAICTADEPATAQCPDKCTDLHWAQKECGKLEGCEVVKCTRNISGKTHIIGAKCTKISVKPTPSSTPTSTPSPTPTSEPSSSPSSSPTPTPSLIPKLECPDKCIDPKWAKKKCEGLKGCEVVACTRLVRGKTERAGAKCTAIKPKLECPNKCIDPRWAEEKCSHLPHCKVVECTRLVKGEFERPGAMCTDM